MKIGVEVNDFFKRYNVKTGKFEIDLQQGANVSALLEKLNLPKEKVGFVIVNQKRVDESYVFAENDSVYISPLAMGG